MKIRQRMVTLSVAALLGAAAGAAQGQQGQAPQGQAPVQQRAGGSSVWAAPPAPGGQQSTSPSACGNQPMCYDSQDFAVAVVDFRMSVTNGWKVMDATLRFVNKTNQPLILGYVDTSALALDDQGNRYSPYGNRNLAGIGIVSGNSGDPKFVLQPGGAGDARWELIWRPGAQDPVGSTFDLNMTIREMNTLTGGAHTLGAEVPLRFQGLANGMTGSGGATGYSGAAGAPGTAGGSAMMANGSSGLPPCGTDGSGTLNQVAGAANSVGGQQTAAATNTANNGANSAAAAYNNLKSIFGKHPANNASAPATNVAGAAPCVPAATSAPVVAGTSTAPAAASQAAGTAPNAAVSKTQAATATKTAATPNAAPNAAHPPATAATPSTAAKPAVVKTAAPNTKPAAQPATQPVKKPAPQPAPNTTTNPPPKPQ